MKLYIGIAALLFAAACGSDDSTSGVDGGKRLSSLTSSERTSLCRWVIDVESDVVGEECGPDSPSELDDCVEELGEFPASCRVTVSEAEDCIEAQIADPCEEDHPECDVLDACDD